MKIMKTVEKLKGSVLTPLQGIKFRHKGNMFGSVAFGYACSGRINTYHTGLHTFLQVRGSAPALWVATPDLSPEPRMRFNRSSEAHAAALSAHVSHLQELYQVRCQLAFLMM